MNISIKLFLKVDLKKNKENAKSRVIKAAILIGIKFFGWK